MRLFYLITGGRPMKRMNETRFDEQTERGMLLLYEDRFGRTYLARGPWAWVRVGINVTVD